MLGWVTATYSAALLVRPKLLGKPCGYLTATGGLPRPVGTLIAAVGHRGVGADDRHGARRDRNRWRSLGFASTPQPKRCPGDRKDPMTITASQSLTRWPALISDQHGHHDHEP